MATQLILVGNRAYLTELQKKHGGDVTLSEIIKLESTNIPYENKKLNTWVSNEEGDEAVGR